MIISPVRKNCNLAQVYFLKLSALTQLSSCITLLDVKIDCEATDLTNRYFYLQFLVLISLDDTLSCNIELECVSPC